MSFDSLPGGDLIEAGIRDLAPGAETIPALHRLFALLATEDPRTAHSRYNALVRRLVSFERAAQARRPSWSGGVPPRLT